MITEASLSIPEHPAISRASRRAGAALGLLEDQRKCIFIFWNIWYSADQGGKQMKEILLLLGFLAFWIVLQKYILPRLGVQT